MKTIVRYIIGIVCWLIGHRDIRYKWLSHYLIGNGRSLRVPAEVVDESINQYVATSCAGEAYRPDSSRRLFWLVGTFTWSITDAPGGKVMYGVDRYDWHANRFYCPNCGAWGYDIEDGYCQYCGAAAEPDWWWSPTLIPSIVAKTMRAIWPACRDYIDIGDMGTLAISNGFWPFIGGTEFDTIIIRRIGLLPA